MEGEKRLTPATFFRHRHLKPAGIPGSADHVISRPQVLHCTLLRSRPMSFRNCMAMPWSQNRYARKSLFGPLSSRNIGHSYEDLSTNGISCRRFSYSLTTSQFFHHCLNKTKGTAHCTQRFQREECLLHRYRRCVALWVVHKKNAREKVNGIQVSEWEHEEMKRKWVMNFNYTNSLKPNLTFVCLAKWRR